MDKKQATKERAWGCRQLMLLAASLALIGCGSGEAQAPQPDAVTYEAGGAPTEDAVATADASPVGDVVDSDLERPELADTAAAEDVDVAPDANVLFCTWAARSQCRRRPCGTWSCDEEARDCIQTSLALDESPCFGIEDEPSVCVEGTCQPDRSCVNRDDGVSCATADAEGTTCRDGECRGLGTWPDGACVSGPGRQLGVRTPHGCQPETTRVDPCDGGAEWEGTCYPLARVWAVNERSSHADALLAIDPLTPPPTQGWWLYGQVQASCGFGCWVGCENTYADGLGMFGDGWEPWQALIPDGVGAFMTASIGVDLRAGVEDTVRPEQEGECAFGSGYAELIVEHGGHSRELSIESAPPGGVVDWDQDFWEGRLWSSAPTPSDFSVAVTVDTEIFESSVRARVTLDRFFLGECPYNPCGYSVLAEGTCVSFSAVEGEMLCDEGCVDINTDPGNCGGCNQRCAWGDACVGGVCAGGA